MADSRKEFKSLLESTFISAKWDERRINAEMISFLNKVISLMPERLYRYRKLDEKGYSLNSFEKGTIALCKANCFSDKYDSLVYVNVDQQVAIAEESTRNALYGLIRDIELKNPSLRGEKVVKIRALLEQGMSEDNVVNYLMKEDYSSFLNDLRHDLKLRESRFRESPQTARIACFTESIQSKFMWDTYAGGYKGFAIEYNLKEYLINCLNKGRAAYTFPVIYTNERPDLTIQEANDYVISKAQEMGYIKNLYLLKPFLQLNLLSPYRPYLYKDKHEYGHEKEWRMLFYDEKCSEDHIEIPDDGCLKAIYYGMDIKPEDQERLHQIAQKKGIKEYKVSIDEDSPKYSLKVIPLDS